MAASIGALLLGLLLRIGPGEWLGIILAIGAVWFSEAVNTAIERLADAVTPEHDPNVKIAKDCAAAAVLIASAVALLIGLIIFVPRLGDFQ